MVKQAMRIISALASVGMLSITGVARANDLTISISGACPGTLAFRWEGATPHCPAGLIVGRQMGHTTLPATSCNGTVLGIERSLQLVVVFHTRSDGRGRFTGTASQDLCGQFAQMMVIDGHPCSTSNVVQISQ